MTSRFLIVLLSLSGLLISIALSVAHVSGTSSCPLLLAIPACFIVAGGYFLILISSGLSNVGRKVLLLVGLAPVLLLASAASVFEFLQGPVCPSPYGLVPLCYVSFLLSTLIGGIWALELHHSRTHRHRGTLR